jgi:HlyD family secretion protein
VPTRDLSKLSAEQNARIKVIGIGDIEGRVRRVATSVEPSSQLGQVVIGLSVARRLMTNSYARATIKTGESCGIALPLTAILYTSGGTVVQVVRRYRVETKRVEVGLMSGGQVEIREGLSEGEIVVARAGALLREGDAVRPVMTASGNDKK